MDILTHIEALLIEIQVLELKLIHDQRLCRIDNAPSHRTRATQHFLTQNTPEFIKHTEWSPNSPDCNPLDDSIWTVLSEAVYRNRHEKFSSLDSLKQGGICDIEQSTVSGKSFDTMAAPHTFLDHDASFFHGFVASLSVNIVSELGDKTFLIAAIMAMRHPRVAVFSGAMLALTFMTLFAVVIGCAATVIPEVYTQYASAALFALFGVKMLQEGIEMSGNEGQEEFEEVQADLQKKEEVIENASLMILIQSFTLTFVSEWGDRSQLATIALTARQVKSFVFLGLGFQASYKEIISTNYQNVWGVGLGSFCGQGLSTALAIIGGRMIAQKISVKIVTILGGFVFLSFVLSTLCFPPD
ncbi:unnamed protein product [Darwinula stevensoni]|uniref:GDT1 family protein n=1 Tax=Darwinula stevensoni TaxID=69355 RepID=A0A7R9AD36_9CRUS|nr:unnamed protein product [Darwinula stevensoni]CAG0900941.1 unnamed protein product [Darwinula stevensoni]